MPTQAEKSTQGRKPIVVIIDSKELRRVAIEGLLEDWADAEGFETISTTPDGAVAPLNQEFDCRMMVFNVGGESIASNENMQMLTLLRARMPNIPLVIITDYETPHETAAALFAGAQGYFQSGMGLELAVQALSLVLHGGSYYPISALRQLVCRMEQDNGELQDTSNDYDAFQAGPTLIDCRPANGSNSPRSELTDRQKEVLGFVGQGLTNKSIARRLGMAETTVKVHMRQIMRKLGAVNRVQAAVWIRSTDRP
jgi:DNA-binding NarL/FixJ family response regulator